MALWSHVFQHEPLNFLPVDSSLSIAKKIEPKQKLKMKDEKIGEPFDEHHAYTKIHWKIWYVSKTENGNKSYIDF